MSPTHRRQPSLTHCFRCAFCAPFSVCHNSDFCDTLPPAAKCLRQRDSVHGPTAQNSQAGRARLVTLCVALALIRVAACGVVMGVRAAGGRFGWPASLSRAFGSSSAPTLPALTVASTVYV